MDTERWMKQLPAALAVGVYNCVTFQLSNCERTPYSKESEYCSCSIAGMTALTRHSGQTGVKVACGSLGQRYH